MKHRRPSVSFLICGLLCVCAPALFAQKTKTIGKPEERKIIYIVPPRRTPAELATIRNQSASGSTIALWNYNFRAYDGNIYSGEMVGRNPLFHGHRMTTIPTYVIPVIFTFDDTGEVFDPTTPDGCLFDNSNNSISVDTAVLNSPIFQNSDFVMNGVDVGSTQYLDAFERANFWVGAAGTPYHTVFSTTPTVLAPINVEVSLANGFTNFGVCRDIGEMDQAWWDNLLQTTIIPSLAAQGVGPTSFPQFIFDSVAMTIQGNCCALGYHGNMLNGGVFQTYSANDFDTSGAFGGDNTSTMSHEVAEWMDDPAGSNAVPAWGAEGQVTAGNCQNNLEVGDPLSPGFSTPTNPFSVTLNNFTYTLQELAFFSWFYGGSSLGAGGKYSDNGTFRGYAKACPPGGTH